MTDLYLITGFLGAGKTTFLRELAAVLAPRRLAVIVNEFGDTDVDAVLLQGVSDDVQAIVDGSIFCSCRLDRFEAALSMALSQGPDAIVVEASGLADPSSIRAIVADARFAGVRVASIACLVDAQRYHRVRDTAVAVAKQLAVSDLILVNKADAVDPQRVSALVGELQAAYPGARVFATRYGHIEPDWLHLPRRAASQGSRAHARDLTLQKCRIDIPPTWTRAQLEGFIGAFVDQTHRVKGIVALHDGRYRVDCVGAQVRIWPYEAPGSLPPCESPSRRSEGRGQGDSVPLRDSKGQSPLVAPQRETPPASAIVALASRGMALRDAVRAAATTARLDERDVCFDA